MGAAYDEVPYPGAAFPQTHPDRLATLARLYGGRPAPVDECRFLELGCGDGGNLLPMAYALPGATFVGVDLSGAALARGQDVAARLGLENVELRRADILALDPRALGRFDYVVAHGVFSWVPDPVRDALLAVMAGCLERDGVAFVSFNALPGGHLRQLLRGVLRWHLRDVAGPRERLAAAREMLGLLARTPAYARELQAEAERMRDRADAALFHDDLAEVNDAFHLHEVLARASAHGLRFLAEAVPKEGAEAPAREVAAGLDELGGDRVAREQYHDVLTLRRFRQVLLRRADARGGDEPDPAAVRYMLVASSLQPRGGEKGRLQKFTGSQGGSLTVDHPFVKRALTRLGGAWPRPVAFTALAAGATPSDEAALAHALLRAHAGGLAELHVWAPELPDTPGNRPVATALARLQAEQGPDVTTLRHETVHLDDERSRRLVTLLDGTRDRSALTEAMGLGRRDDRELAEQLDRLAAAALLEPPGATGSR